MFDSVFGRSFSSAKCKTLLRLAIARIKLLRNKREIQLKQMKKELAQLLQSNQEPSARIRVEHIYREQNVMAAYEVIELFCELMVVRLPIIDSQRLCPIDLREAVASLIFAAPRCSDVPELLQVRNLLSAKYGKEFVVAAAELRPDCGVNRLVIEKLSVRAPSGDVKLKLMKDIAVEQNVDWDPTTTESELLKAPEDLLEGPTRFLGASQMSLERTPEDPSTTEPPAEQNQNQKSELQDSKGTAFQSFEASSDEKQFIPFVLPSVEDPTRFSRQQSTSLSVHSQVQHDTQAEESPPTSPPSSLHKRTSLGGDREEDAVRYVNNRDQNFKDVVLAARTAAEAAERAAAAARAAASLASEKFDRNAAESSTDSDDDGGDNIGDLASQLEAGSPEKHMKSQYDDSFNNYSGSRRPLFEEPEEGEVSENANPFATTRRTTPYEDYSDDSPSRAGQAMWPPGGRVGAFDEGDDGLDSGPSFSKSWDMNTTTTETLRGTSVEPVPHFDTDVADAETEVLTPKFAASHVHPKLPDYDDLSARFESLRSKRQ